MTSSQHAGTLPDWGVDDMMADGAPDPNTTRAMGLVPVNALKVASVVGQGPDHDDEFKVTHLIGTRPNHIGKSSGGQQATDHQGNTSS